MQIVEEQFVCVCGCLRCLNTRLAVFAAGHHGEDDEKSEQVRFGAAVRNVRPARRSGTDYQTIFVGQRLGAAHRVRSTGGGQLPDDVELRFMRRVVDQWQGQCEKVLYNIYIIYIFYYI